MLIKRFSLFFLIFAAIVTRGETCVVNGIEWVYQEVDGGLSLGIPGKTAADYHFFKVDVEMTE